MNMSLVCKSGRKVNRLGKLCFEQMHLLWGVKDGYSVTSAREHVT